MIMDIATIVNIILCVLSFILAVTSVITVIITLKQNNKMIEESTRPIITIYTDEINFGTPVFYLVIKNFGKSAAVITDISYNTDFSNCYRVNNGKDYLKELKNAMLAPGQSRVCMLDYQKVNKEVTFIIKYKSGLGKTYSEIIKLDLKAGVAMPTLKANTENKELRTISYALQEMVQKNL